MDMKTTKILPKLIKIFSIPKNLLKQTYLSSIKYHQVWGNELGAMVQKWGSCTVHAPRSLEIKKNEKLNTAPPNMHKVRGVFREETMAELGFGRWAGVTYICVALGLFA